MSKRAILFSPLLKTLQNIAWLPHSLLQILFLFWHTSFCKKILGQAFDLITGLTKPWQSTKYRPESSCRTAALVKTYQSVLVAFPIRLYNEIYHTNE